MKAQIVHIHNCLDPLRQFNINAAVVKKKPRIDKIRLPLNLAAAQTRQQTVRLDQPDASLRQTNSIAHPKRKLTTSEIRIVEDRIKPISSVIRRIRISLCPQKRALESQVVLIDRKFRRCEVRSHFDSSSRNRIVLVVTKRKVV